MAEVACDDLVDFAEDSGDQGSQKSIPVPTAAKIGAAMNAH